MEYRIVRSGRRTLGLQVTRDGELIVRAPRHTSAAAIRSFVMEHADWIARSLELQTQRREAHPEPTSDEADALRALAKAVLPGKVAQYAAVLDVQPTRITVTSARTRFGSCSAKNALSFSWRLMQYPGDAIDYVVVHELCHILHHDHSRAFYACVERVMPDYRRRQKLLRE